MRIAIPLDENKKDVCIVLSRAPFFLICEDGSESIFENPAASANSGAGVEAAQFLCDKEIDVLITVRCGENVAEVLKAADIKILKAKHKTAEEELRAYEAGETEELEHFHGGYHGIL
ncbi:MAG: NifB/NifX family molybdenum-iron cluster-binding protein [Eubacteriales bacterium]|nr:NifB/NifX family molybdenum-iron cluster-binding protein [Eubacteriales bacterium]